MVAGGYLRELDAMRDTADSQLTMANYSLAHGVRSLMDTSDHANALLDAYAALPDRVGAEVSPAWLSLKPEITCRTLEGDGYGGCWHSRITALMSEAANVGGVFTKQFPAFSASVNGIAGDVHTFTSKAVAPRGFWGTFKDILSTGSGVARAAGAAGLFEQRVPLGEFRRMQVVQ
jgi:hypothetical protein